jgi:hypothetical protein
MSHPDAQCRANRQDDQYRAIRRDLLLRQQLKGNFQEPLLPGLVANPLRPAERLLGLARRQASKLTRSDQQVLVPTEFDREANQLRKLPILRILHLRRGRTDSPKSGFQESFLLNRNATSQLPPHSRRLGMNRLKMAEPENLTPQRQILGQRHPRDQQLPVSNQKLKVRSSLHYAH